MMPDKTRLACVLAALCLAHGALTADVDGMSQSSAISPLQAPAVAEQMLTLRSQNR